MSTERFVWVDDCQFRCIPIDFASFGVKIPFSLGNQEVVILDFSIEVVRRNIEISWPSIEVEMDSVALSNSCFPWVMILVGVEWIDCIGPCFFKALNLLIVFFLSEGNHKVFVLDNSAISQYNLVFIGINLVDSDVVWLANVLADGLTGWCAEVKLGDAKAIGGLTCLARRGFFQRWKR